MSDQQPSQLPSHQGLSNSPPNRPPPASRVSTPTSSLLPRSAPLEAASPIGLISSPFLITVAAQSTRSGSPKRDDPPLPLPLPQPTTTFATAARKPQVTLGSVTEN